MKKELDPFESKLKEKLQGKAAFPEEILWKRLNDELIRSDQKVLSKNYYWLIGTALLVLLSLGTGYLIGMRQGSPQIVSTKNYQGLREKKVPSKSQLSSNQNENQGVNLKGENVQSKEIIQDIPIEGLSQHQLHVDAANSEYTKQLHLYTLNASTGNDFRNQNNSIGEQDASLSSRLTTKKINQNNHSSSELLHTTASFIPAAQSTDQSSHLLTEQSNLLPFDVESDFIIEKIAILPITCLPTCPQISLAKGLPYKRHIPSLFSASIGFEPTAFNRLKPLDIYGSGNVNSSNEKGLSSTNLKLAVQAQLGRHFEIGVGLGSSSYVTLQKVQNQLVQIDPFVNQLNFESSIGNFQIHENHLMDDPEDQEENELNFQDSTAFHLNYQLSNTVKSIQVPITAGFIFQLNKVKFTMKTGLIYNHITQATQILNIRGFNAIQNNIASQLISNSYFHLIQLGAEYPVSEHFSVMLAPKYSYALKSISKSTILRPNSIGIECALKFYF